MFTQRSTDKNKLQHHGTRLASFLLTCTTVAAWTKSSLLGPGCRPAAGRQVKVEARAAHVQARGRRRGWLRWGCSRGLCSSALSQHARYFARLRGAGTSSLACLDLRLQHNGKTPTNLKCGTGCTPSPRQHQSGCQSQVWARSDAHGATAPAQAETCLGANSNVVGQRYPCVAC